MHFKTCRPNKGGCGGSFKTTHKYAILCNVCKMKKYNDKMMAKVGL